MAATLSRACVLAFAAAAGRLGAQYVVVGFSVVPACLCASDSSRPRERKD